jgi:hypothetical protein
LKTFLSCRHFNYIINIGKIQSFTNGKDKLMMNTKKFLAGILAMASVASCASVMANAEEVNVVGVSYETLAASVVANDGTEIPAGSIAVSVSVANNAGFQGDSLTFNVGNAVALTNADGAPVVDNGEVLGEDATVSSAQNSSTFVVAYVATEEKDADGELFTFYLSDPADVTVSETEALQTSVADDTNITVRKYWIRGDVNGDLYIGVEDAVDMSNAITRAGGRMLDTASANENLSYFFPDTLLPDANYLDGNGDECLMDGTVEDDLSDVQHLLTYYAQTASGTDYDDPGWYFGEKIWYTVTL